MSQLNSQHAKCSWTMALQTFSLLFFSNEAQLELRCLPPRDLSILAWRGTSGCSINITSGPRRHMTPKWAFQRRVDGILRFAMSPTSLAAPKRPVRPSTPLQPANAVRRIRYVDVASTSTMAASKELRTRALVSPPPLAGNSCTSLGSLARPQARPLVG
ncbi:hypothetical protein V8C34DRAFT_275602 [Trichoderma compactum]